MDRALDDALDLTTFWRMVATALAHPWELLGDVAPGLAQALAHAVVAVDRALVHVAWLLGFLGFGGAA